jgi:Flp pilus assembly protein TadD
MRLGRRRSLAVMALLAAVAVVAAFHASRYATVKRPAARPAPATAFVGAAACATCHRKEYDAWRGSHHELAMQEAARGTVLGDFDDAALSYAGTTSTFFRRGGAFFVRTDGPDGRLRDYPIKYTFGVSPLQQYLVELPGGRLQALPMAWDSRPKGRGGDRWFHLYPGERIDHRDPLHWTGRDQNWNWMCADCHSTGLTRNYDLASDSYKTSWAEMNVACEACHGAGSLHVAWARQPANPNRAADNGLAVRLNERMGVSWRIDPASGNAVRSRPRTSRREIDACARCHARRATLADGAPGPGLMDHYDPALLTGDLYFADGQQKGEVYEYASFLQSRMYAHGVTCSDCHDPHTGRMRAPGNGVCLECHAGAKYEPSAHTLHRDGSPGASCTACHMPARTYMVVDARRDHSIRIPRPDMTIAFGVPNACSACHPDKSPQWADAAIGRRFGPRRTVFQRFADALHAVRTGAPGAAGKLLGLARDASAPAIARATALAELRSVHAPASVPAIDAGLRDADPLVRGAAARALLTLDPVDRLRLAEPHLGDPVRAVRLHLARALAAAPLENVAPVRQELVRALFEEYVSSEQAAAERPEAHMNLAAFHTDRGALQQAEHEYRIAIRLQPSFVPAYVNLSDHFRVIGRDADSEATLRKGLEHAPGDGDLSYALALARIRQGGDRGEALDLLRQAARTRSDNPRYAYVYAVALRDAGRPADGLAVLESALARFPNDPDLLFTAAIGAYEAGRRARASDHARVFAAVAPDDPRAGTLMRELGIASTMGAAQPLHRQ